MKVSHQLQWQKKEIELDSTQNSSKFYLYGLKIALASTQAFSITEEFPNYHPGHQNSGFGGAMA